MNPTATPIITCCRAIQTAFGEKIGISTAGREGATIIVITMPSPILTRLGTDFSLSMGAVEISAMMRSIGQK